MCRALKVLCVTEDPEGLAALKRAAVSADWELAPGAATEQDGLEQLEAKRPTSSWRSGTWVRSS